MTSGRNFGARAGLCAMVGAALFMAGCATQVMSEKECLAGDWPAAGFEDGAAGLLESAFEGRAARCAEFGAPADRGAYMQARETALYQLCTDDGGYGYGRAGKSYLGVCAAAREPEFLGGYLSGRRIFVFEQQREAARLAYNSALSDIEGLRENIRRARARLDNPEADEKQIRKARQQISYNRDLLSGAQDQANQNLYELGRADEALDRAIRGADVWARSEEFGYAYGTLLQAQDFARSESAINFCTDELPFYAPRCELRFDGVLSPGQRSGQRSGEGVNRAVGAFLPGGGVCARGPGELRFDRAGRLGAGRAGGNGQDTGFTQFFDFYPRDERDRLSRAPAAGVQLFFSADGTYEGLACSAPSLPR